MLTLAAPAALVASSPAFAWEYRTRFVERIGTSDVILGDIVEFAPGSTHRLRFQAGVFDNDDGAAPAGGFNGYTIGTIQTFGGGTWTRTPGRLAPFVFFPGPNANGNPPLPAGDPFTALSEIDAAIAIQSFPWTCDAQGNPNPMPLPVIRGRNEFISTYEITVVMDTRPTGELRVVFGGQFTAADDWRIQGNPVPPDCDAGEPGSVFYFCPLNGSRPLLTEELRIIPAPGSACLALLVAPLTRRRRPR
jgi:hypothetical protein